MANINIFVKNKIASTDFKDKIILNNTDYTINFTFDSEWANLSTKTMRVQFGDYYIDTTFSGGTCTLPLLACADKVEIGVYSGTTKTTTPCVIECEKSILTDGGSNTTAPTPTQYEQIIALLNSTSANVVKVGHTATITITDLNGTTTAQVNDGATISTVTLKEQTAQGNVYTVTMTDGTTWEFTAPRGESGSNPHWNNIQGKPSTFPPSEHNHDDRYYTESEVDGLLSPINTELETLENNVGTINTKIPSQATASNQLGDKDFINSSIATNTANYISNNGQPFNSVAQLEAYQGTVTNNDYAFVTGTDEQGNTYYDRYKATYVPPMANPTWAKEFRLNNSSFTANQWASITSGITSALVNKLDNIDLTNYVQKTDYATYSNGGTIKTGNAVTVTGNGNIACEQKTYGVYGNANVYTFIGKGTLENVANARGWTTAIKTDIDSVLTVNTKYYIGEQTSLTLTFPTSGVSAGQSIVVQFSSGATACSLTTNLQDFSFVPKANKINRLGFEFNGTDWLVDVKEG